MDEIRKQREIGKQLLLVNILRAEEETAKNTGISFVTKEDIARWASMSINDVDSFLYACSKFEKDKMAAEAALAFGENSVTSQDHYLFDFLTYTYSMLENYLLNGYSHERLLEYCEKHVEENYERYNERRNRKAKETFRTENTFERIVRNYLRYFVSAIKSEYEKGYDWDVISEMLWCDITWEDYELLSKEY